MPAILIRGNLDKKAYRLKCRFAIDAAPQKPYYRAIWDRELERAKNKAAEWFVADMHREGWEYLSRYPWCFRGPFPVVPIITLPKRSQQQKWHIPSWELLPALQAGYRPDLDARSVDVAIRNIATLDTSETWEYELSAVFIRPELLIEAPDKKEEQEMIRP